MKKSLYKSVADVNLPNKVMVSRNYNGTLEGHQTISGLVITADNNLAPNAVFKAPDVSFEKDPSFDFFLVRYPPSLDQKYDRYFFPIFFQCSLVSGTGILVMISSYIFAFEKRKGSKFGKTFKNGPLNIINITRAELLKRADGTPVISLFFDNKKVVVLSNISQRDSERLIQSINILRTYRSLYICGGMKYDDIHKDVIDAIIHHLLGMLRDEEPPSITYPPKSKRQMVIQASEMLTKIHGAARIILNKLLFAVRDRYTSLLRTSAFVTLGIDKKTNEMILVRNDVKSELYSNYFTGTLVDPSSCRLILFPESEKFSGFAESMHKDIYELSQRKGESMDDYLENFSLYDSFRFMHPLGISTDKKDRDVRMFDIVLDSFSVYKYDRTNAIPSKLHHDLKVVKYKKTMTDECIVQVKNHKGKIQTFKFMFDHAFQTFFEVNLLLYMALSRDFSILDIDKYDIRHTTEAVVSQCLSDDEAEYKGDSLLAGISKWRKSMMKKYISELILPLTGAALVYINPKGSTDTRSRRKSVGAKSFFKKIVDIDTDSGMVEVEGSGKRRFTLNLDSVIIKKGSHPDGRYVNSLGQKPLSRASTLQNMSLKKRKNFLDFPLEFTFKNCKPKVELSGSFLHVRDEAFAAGSVWYLPRNRVRLKVPDSYTIRIMEGERSEFEKAAEVFLDEEVASGSLEIVFSNAKEYSFFVQSLGYLEALHKVTDNDFEELLTDKKTRKRILLDFIGRVERGEPPFMESAKWRRRLVKSLAKLVSVESPAYDNYVFYEGMFCGIVGDLDYENGIVRFMIDEHSIHVCEGQGGAPVSRGEKTVKISEAEVIDGKVLTKVHPNYANLLAPTLSRKVKFEVFETYGDNSVFPSKPPVAVQIDGCILKSLTSDRGFPKDIEVSMRIDGWNVSIRRGQEVLWQSNMQSDVKSKVLFIGRIDAAQAQEVVLVDKKYGTVRIEVADDEKYRKAKFSVRFLQGLCRITEPSYYKLPDAASQISVYVRILNALISAKIPNVSEELKPILIKNAHIATVWRQSLISVGLRHKLHLEGKDDGITFTPPSPDADVTEYIYFYEPHEGLSSNTFYTIETEVLENSEVVYRVGDSHRISSLGSSFKILKVYRSLDESTSSKKYEEVSSIKSPRLTLAKTTGKRLAGYPDIELTLEDLTVTERKTGKKTVISIGNIKKAQILDGEILLTLVGASPFKLRVSKKYLLVWLYYIYYAMDYHYNFRRSVWESAAGSEDSPIQKYFTHMPHVYPQLFLFNENVQLGSERDIGRVEIQKSIIRKVIHLPLVTFVKQIHPQYGCVYEPMLRRALTETLVYEQSTRIALDLTQEKLDKLEAAGICDEELSQYHEEMTKKFKVLKDIMNLLLYKEAGSGPIGFDELKSKYLSGLDIPRIISPEKCQEIYRVSPALWKHKDSEVDFYKSKSRKRADVRVDYPYFYFGRHMVVSNGRPEKISTVWIIGNQLLVGGHGDIVSFRDPIFKRHGFFGDDFVIFSLEGGLTRISDFRGTWEDYTKTVEDLKAGKAGDSYYLDTYCEVRKVLAWITKVKSVRCTYLDSVLVISDMLQKVMGYLEDSVRESLMKKIPSHLRDARALFVVRDLYVKEMVGNLVILDPDGDKYSEKFLDGGKFYEFVSRSGDDYILCLSDQDFELVRVVDAIVFNEGKEEHHTDRVLNSLLLRSEPLLRLLLEFNTTEQKEVVSNLKKLFLHNKMKLVLCSLHVEIERTQILQLVRANTIRSKLIISHFNMHGIEYVRSVVLKHISAVEDKIKEEIRSRVANHAQRDLITLFLDLRDIEDLYSVYGHMKVFKVSSMCHYILTLDDSSIARYKIPPEEVEKMKMIHSQLRKAPRSEITREAVLSCDAAIKELFSVEEATELCKKMSDELLIRLFESFDEIPVGILEVLHAAAVQLHERFGEEGTRLGINALFFLRFLIPFITFVNIKFLLEKYVINPLVASSRVNFTDIAKQMQSRLNRMDEVKGSDVEKGYSAFIDRLLNYQSLFKDSGSEGGSSISPEVDLSVESPLRYVQMPDEFLRKVAELGIDERDKKTVSVFLDQRFRI